MSDYQTIIFDKRDGIARITLNRPKHLNAYNIQMRDELYQVLGAIKDDNELNVVIVNGAGDRAFCAGADLTEFLTAPSPVIARQVRWERDIWGEFLKVPQPIIASVHGFVLGSGLEMALCCDLRIASEEAQFGLPETKLGLIPAAGATQTAPRTIGIAETLDMLLTGRWLTAQEAYQSKLVNRVVARDKLSATVESLAAKIASLDRIVVRAAKQALVRGRDLPLKKGLEMEMGLAMLVRQSKLSC